MLPWSSYSAFDFHFPFGGNVAQDIRPTLDRFFGAIPPEAGNGEIEKKIFTTSSYGRQLGLITEVLLAVAKEHPIRDSSAARKSLERLECEDKRIQAIKKLNRARAEDAAVEILEKLERSDSRAFHRVMKRFDGR